MNISTFLSTISNAGGLARPNKYLVQIYATTLVAKAVDPSWMTDYAAVDIQEASSRLTFMCARTTLPNYQFEMDSQRIFGPSYKFPHLPQYQDVVMTFYVGQDMQEKYFFDAWMYLIMDPTTNWFNYVSEYACPIDIMQCDESDNNTYTTKLIDAYPVAVGDLQLAWDNNNQVHKLDVTFTYKFAIPFVGKESSSGTPVRGTQHTFNSTIHPK